MISKAFSQIWHSLFGEKAGRKNGGIPAAEPLKVLPITTGLWIDSSVTEGPGAGTTASELVWLSVDEEGRLSKGLKVLLLPN